MPDEPVPAMILTPCPTSLLNALIAVAGIGGVVDVGRIDGVPAALALRIGEAGLEAVELLLPERGEPAGLRVDEGDVDRLRRRRAPGVDPGRRRAGKTRRDERKPRDEERGTRPACRHCNPPTFLGLYLRPDSGVLLQTDGMAVKHVLQTREAVRSSEKAC